MSDRVLTIPIDPPAAVLAGSPDDYGAIDVASVQLAAELATKAYRQSAEVAERADDVESLRRAVNDLSDAVNTIAGQLYQIAHGLETGRLAVTRPSA